VTLKDSKGGIVGVFVDENFDVRSLPVGPVGKAEVVWQVMSFALSPRLHGEWRPGIREPGGYEVYISIGTRTGTPKIALPLPDSDGKCRYRLGTLRVVTAKEE
jgi:hypothetical protein